MTPPRGQIVLVILSATLTGIMGNTLIAPSIPDILDDFDVGDGGAGLIIAATSFPGIFLAPVIGLLADPYFRMRGWAADACGNFGIKKAIPSLLKMRDGDANGGNRRAARKALERLGVKPEKKAQRTD